VNINGKLIVVQARDYYADHNTFVENQIRDWAQKMGYALDHSYIEAYAGSGDVVQKLTAAVQAGDAPDVLIHNSIQPSQMHFQTGWQVLGYPPFQPQHRLLGAAQCIQGCRH
jgi:ABC-type glycerol-3-phosphate transport system substrate-binding protein